MQKSKNRTKRTSLNLGGAKKTNKKENKEKPERVRLQDERLAIFHFGRLVERSLREDAKIEDMDVEFRQPNVSPDAIFYLAMKNGEKYRLNVEFEGWSSNFVRHDHERDTIKTDLLVCMLHDWSDSAVPILDVVTGRVFKRHEDVKGSFYEQLKRLRRDGGKK